MPEPTHTPHQDTDFLASPLWALGVIDGHRGIPRRTAIGDGWLRYVFGWFDGEALRKAGQPVDEFLTGCRSPYREAHFRPLPPLTPEQGTSAP